MFRNRVSSFLCSILQWNFIKFAVGQPIKSIGKDCQKCVHFTSCNLLAWAYNLAKLFMWYQNWQPNSPNKTTSKWLLSEAKNSLTTLKCQWLVDEYQFICLKYCCHRNEVNFFRKSVRIQIQQIFHLFEKWKTWK